MRLIDADTLKREIENSWNWATVDGITATAVLKQTLHDIDNAPTIKPSLNLDNITEDDIEKFKTIWQRATGKGVILETERPHGKWINHRTIIHDGEYYCSNCDEVAEWLDGGSQFLSKFCPNCGANMRPTETLSETAGKVADDCLNRIMGGGI